MTTIDRTIRKRASNGEAYSSCLVTRSPRLAERLRAALGEHPIKVKRSLAELTAEKECRTIIVDTEVDDMDLWPAPLLLPPDARSRSWVFIVPEGSNLGPLNSIPPDSALFYGKFENVDALADYLRRHLDPEAGRRIDRVRYMSAERTFIVRMESGRAYALRLNDLPEADQSNVIYYHLAKSHHHFAVKQSSGNKLEVPWDDVLYHCEPNYEYYKGKELPGTGRDRDIRIGRRIREMRTAKGLSVTDLARLTAIKRPNLSRLEHGKHVPSLETLERIARALDASIAELVAAGRGGKLFITTAQTSA